MQKINMKKKVYFVIGGKKRFTSSFLCKKLTYRTIATRRMRVKKAKWPKSGRNAKNKFKKKLKRYKIVSALCIVSSKALLAFWIIC